MASEIDSATMDLSENCSNQPPIAASSPSSMDVHLRGDTTSRANGVALENSLRTETDGTDCDDDGDYQDALTDLDITGPTTSTADNVASEDDSRLDEEYQDASIETPPVSREKMAAAKEKSPHLGEGTFAEEEKSILGEGTSKAVDKSISSAGIFPVIESNPVLRKGKSILNEFTSTAVDKSFSSGGTPPVIRPGMSPTTEESSVLSEGASPAIEKPCVSNEVTYPKTEKSSACEGISATEKPQVLDDGTFHAFEKSPVLSEDPSPAMAKCARDEGPSAAMEESPVLDEGTPPANGKPPILSESTLLEKEKCVGNEGTSLPKGNATVSNDENSKENGPPPEKTNCLESNPTSCGSCSQPLNQPTASGAPTATLCDVIVEAMGKMDSHADRVLGIQDGEPVSHKKEPIEFFSRDIVTPQWPPNQVPKFGPQKTSKQLEENYFTAIVTFSEYPAVFKAGRMVHGTVQIANRVGIPCTGISLYCQGMLEMETSKFTPEPGTKVYLGQSQPQKREGKVVKEGFVKRLVHNDDVIVWMPGDGKAELPQGFHTLHFAFQLPPNARASVIEKYFLLYYKLMMGFSYLEEREYIRFFDLAIFTVQPMPALTSVDVKDRHKEAFGFGRNVILGPSPETGQMVKIMMRLPSSVFEVGSRPTVQILVPQSLSMFAPEVLLYPKLVQHVAVDIEAERYFFHRTLRTAVPNTRPTPTPRAGALLVYSYQMLIRDIMPSTINEKPPVEDLLKVHYTMELELKINKIVKVIAKQPVVIIQRLLDGQLPVDDPKLVVVSGEESRMKNNGAIYKKVTIDTKYNFPDPKTFAVSANDCFTSILERLLEKHLVIAPSAEIKVPYSKPKMKLTKAAFYSAAKSQDIRERTHVVEIDSTIFSTLDERREKEEEVLRQFFPDLLHEELIFNEKDCAESEEEEEEEEIDSSRGTGSETNCHLTSPVIKTNTKSGKKRGEKVNSKRPTIGPGDHFQPGDEERKADSNGEETQDCPDGDGTPEPMASQMEDKKSNKKEETNRWECFSKTPRVTVCPLQPPSKEKNSEKQPQTVQSGLVTSEGAGARPKGKSSNPQNQNAQQLVSKDIEEGSKSSNLTLQDRSPQNENPDPIKEKSPSKGTEDNMSGPSVATALQTLSKNQKKLNKAMRKIQKNLQNKVGAGMEDKTNGPPTDEEINKFLCLSETRYLGETIPQAGLNLPTAGNESRPSEIGDGATTQPASSVECSSLKQISQAKKYHSVDIDNSTAKETSRGGETSKPPGSEKAHARETADHVVSTVKDESNAKHVGNDTDQLTRPNKVNDNDTPNESKADQLSSPDKKKLTPLVDKMDSQMCPVISKATKSPFSDANLSELKQDKNNDSTIMEVSTTCNQIDVKESIKPTVAERMRVAEGPPASKAFQKSTICEVANHPEKLTKDDEKSLETEPVGNANNTHVVTANEKENNGKTSAQGYQSGIVKPSRPITKDENDVKVKTELAKNEEIHQILGSANETKELGRNQINNLNSGAIKEINEVPPVHLTLPDTLTSQAMNYSVMTGTEASSNPVGCSDEASSHPREKESISGTNEANKNLDEEKARLKSSRKKTRAKKKSCAERMKHFTATKEDKNMNRGKPCDQQTEEFASSSGAVNSSLDNIKVNDAPTCKSYQNTEGTTDLSQVNDNRVTKDCPERHEECDLSVASFESLSHVEQDSGASKSTSSPSLNKSSCLANISTNAAYMEQEIKSDGPKGNRISEDPSEVIDGIRHEDMMTLTRTLDMLQSPRTKGLRRNVAASDSPFQPSFDVSIFETLGEAVASLQLMTDEEKNQVVDNTPIPYLHLGNDAFDEWLESSLRDYLPLYWLQPRADVPIGKSLGTGNTTFDGTFLMNSRYYRNLLHSERDSPCLFVFQLKFIAQIQKLVEAAKKIHPSDCTFNLMAHGQCCASNGTGMELFANRRRALFQLMQGISKDSSLPYIDSISNNPWDLTVSDMKLLTDMAASPGWIPSFRENHSGIRRVEGMNTIVHTDSGMIAIFRNCDVEQGSCSTFSEPRVSEKESKEKHDSDVKINIRKKAKRVRVADRLRSNMPPPVERNDSGSNESSKSSMATLPVSRDKSLASSSQGSGSDDSPKSSMTPLQVSGAKSVAFSSQGSGSDDSPKSSMTTLQASGAKSVSSSSQGSGSEDSHKSSITTLQASGAKSVASSNQGEQCSKGGNKNQTAMQKNQDNEILTYYLTSTNVPNFSPPNLPQTKNVADIGGLQYPLSVDLKSSNHLMDKYLRKLLFEGETYYGKQTNTKTNALNGLCERYNNKDFIDINILDYKYSLKQSLTIHANEWSYKNHQKLKGTSNSIKQTNIRQKLDLDTQNNKIILPLNGELTKSSIFIASNALSQCNNVKRSVNNVASINNLVPFGNSRKGHASQITRIGVGEDVIESSAGKKCGKQQKIYPEVEQSMTQDEDDPVKDELLPFGIRMPHRPEWNIGMGNNIFLQHSGIMCCSEKHVWSMDVDVVGDPDAATSKPFILQKSSMSRNYNSQKSSSNKEAKLHSKNLFIRKGRRPIKATFNERDEEYKSLKCKIRWYSSMMSTLKSKLESSGWDFEKYNRLRLLQEEVNSLKAQIKQLENNMGSQT